LSLTAALEDYLETIYLLSRDAAEVRVRDIAKARDVKASSVTPALKRLAEVGHVRYVQREHVALTEQGAEEARRILARHELLARFFTEILGMAEAAAEREACAMEHSLSNEAMDRLVRFFEHLTVCPKVATSFLETFRGCSRVHAEKPACEVARCPASRDVEQHLIAANLYELKAGFKGRVRQIRAQGAVRQRLLDMGILPNTEVTMERSAPGGDPIWVKVHGTQLALRKNEALSILIDFV